MALFQLLDKHERLTLGRQDGSTRTGSYAIYDGFEPLVLADIRHDAELNAKHPGYVRDDLPVADVARDHHDTPAA